MLRSIFRMVVLLGPVELVALALFLGTVGVWFVTIESLLQTGCFR